MKKSSHQNSTVSAVFDNLESWAKDRESLPLGELITRLGEQGLGLIVVVLSIPFLQPIPMFGLSTVLGLVMMVVGVAIFLDQKAWMPRKLAARTVPASLVIAICHGGRKVFAFLEKFIRPRANFLHQGRSMKRLSGLFIFLSAFLLALPLPIPGTNTPPAAALLLLSLGFIERDGYAIVLGYLAFSLTCIYFLFLAWASYHGVNYAIPFLKT
jgi:hypothetical protein